MGKLKMAVTIKEKGLIGMDVHFDGKGDDLFIESITYPDQQRDVKRLLAEPEDDVLGRLTDCLHQEELEDAMDVAQDMDWREQ